MTDTIEAVARSMAEAKGLDWDGKAKGTEYANHGYWLPLAQAAIAAHIKALVEGAGEIAKRLEDHARAVGGDDSFERLYGSEAVEAAATIAALKAENERLAGQAAKLWLLARRYRHTGRRLPVAR